MKNRIKNQFSGQGVLETNNQTPKKFTLPAINFEFKNFGWADISKWSDKKKLVFAGSLSLLVVIIAGLGYNYFSNPVFRFTVNNLIWGQGSDLAERRSFINSATDDLQKAIEEFDQQNRGNFYRTYTIRDLDIYPRAWVERKFSGAEQSNLLISGPSADPDGDGLINKEEYFYGSNPKMKRTLCDGIKEGEKPISTSPFQCDNRSDKQLVDSNLSPLTGLELDIIPTFRVMNQDFALINSLKETVEKASQEGVDFPELYQASRLIDLNTVASQIKVNQVDDISTNILEYRNIRSSTLQTFSQDQSASGLSEIYTLTLPEQFDTVKKRYQTQIERLLSTAVPRRYAESHRAYVLIFQKLVELLDIRKQATSDGKLEDPAYREVSRKKAVEVVWGYRRLQEETTKIGE